MDYRRPEPELLLEILNDPVAEPEKKLRANQFTYSAPTPDTNGGNNSRITLTGVPRYGLKGTKTVYYNRIKLSQLFPTGELIMENDGTITAGQKLYDVLAKINVVGGENWHFIETTALVNQNVVVDSSNPNRLKVQLGYTSTGTLVYEGNTNIQVYFTAPTIDVVTATEGVDNLQGFTE